MGSEGTELPGGTAEHLKALPGNIHNPLHIRGGANCGAALLPSLLPITKPSRPPSTACVKSLADHQAVQASTRPALSPLAAPQAVQASSKAALRPLAGP